MYADDLVLVSSSVTELQNMINICCNELDKLDLSLNGSKSSCLRIGKRWHVKCVPLHTTKGEVINWVSSVTYLGVVITTGPTFNFSLDKPKSKFYSSFNAIYCKLGKINNPIVTLHLISTIALPALLYSLEVLPINKTCMKALEHPWSKAFMKNFQTFDMDTVRECQFYTGFKTVEELIKLRKMNFHKSFSHNSGWFSKFITASFPADFA